jgi:pimeloyl-ACP methyl ester carboxylesterase
MHSLAVRFLLVPGLGLDERSSAGLRERVVASVALLGPTTEPRLRSVAGTRDRLCPHDRSARLAVTAPRGRLVESPGAARMTPQTHRDHVAPILLAVAPG